MSNAPLSCRTLPHSIEAEENLLSCCLLDGSDTIARCLEAQLLSSAFYAPANRLIYEKLCELYQSHPPVELAVLAEELKTAQQLEAVGGYAYLTQISARIPTTMQAAFFIEKVGETARLREIIRATTQIMEDCYTYTGGFDELASKADFRLKLAISRNSRAVTHDMDWDELLRFDKRKDPDCLMGNRFLGRTGGCVIVAPSGVGKSVLALQLGACAALGKPFFGLQMVAPMRVLYIQAEDDHGDVAEAAQGFAKGYELTADELADLRKRLRIVRWNDAAGDKFLARLRAEHAKQPFDLVIINPLFSFCGCNVSEQKEMSSFLRNGLNSILNETRAATIIVHHTNKPSADPKNQPRDINAELRYQGSGSGEVTNWARAYVTLLPIRSAGDRVYKMTFAKRGHRAGIVDEEGKPTTSVLIEHSQAGLCWVASSYRPDKDAGGKFQPRFDQQRALQVYDSNLDWPENERRIAEDQGMTTRAVRSHRQALEAVA